MHEIQHVRATFGASEAFRQYQIASILQPILIGFGPTGATSDMFGLCVSRRGAKNSRSTREATPWHGVCGALGPQDSFQNHENTLKQMENHYFWSLTDFGPKQPQDGSRLSQDGPAWPQDGSR